MKKVLFFAAACLSLMACGNKAQSEQAGDSLTAQTADSLVFEGQFPNADGGEMAVKLALEKKGYKLIISENDVRFFANNGDSVLSASADSTLAPSASGLKYDLKRK